MTIADQNLNSFQRKELLDVLQEFLGVFKEVMGLPKKGILNM